MTSEEKTIEYIEWFKENSTPSKFITEVMILSCVLGSMDMEQNERDNFSFKCEVSENNKIKLSMKKVT